MHDVGFGGRRTTRRHIWQGYHLKITNAEVGSVDDLIDVAGDFQDLLCIVTGRNAEFHSMVGWHSDLIRDQPCGEPRQEMFEVMAQWNLRDDSDGQDMIEKYEMFLTMDELGGMAGIAAWMEAAALHRSTLGRTMGTRTIYGMFVTDRLIKYVAALEGFDRRTAASARAKLPARLRRLAQRAGQPFDDIVGSPNKWVDALVWHRNVIAHHLDRQTRGWTTDQCYLTESAHWLTVLIMPREPSAPEGGLRMNRRKRLPAVPGAEDQGRRRRPRTPPGITYLSALRPRRARSDRER